jgi:hypothetical protein
MARAIREAPSELALYEVYKNPAQWVRDASASELDPLLSLLDDRTERIERRGAALALLLSTQRGDVLGGLAGRAAEWSAIALGSLAHPEPTAAEIENGRLFFLFSQRVLDHPAAAELNDIEALRSIVDGMALGLHTYSSGPYEFVERLSVPDDEKSRLVFALTVPAGQRLFSCSQLTLLRDAELELLRQRVRTSSEQGGVDDSAVAALATIGDREGMEAVDEFIKRVSSPQILSTLTFYRQIGGARHAADGLLALIRDDTHADWEVIDLAIGWAESLGVERGPIRRAVLDYGAARRARCDTMPNEMKEASCRRGMMQLLGSVKHAAVRAGILSDSDWPDVVSLNEHVHP